MCRAQSVSFMVLEMGTRDVEFIVDLDQAVARTDTPTSAAVSLEVALARSLLWVTCYESWMLMLPILLCGLKRGGSAWP